MQLPPEWLINMVKMLSFRLQQCFNPLLMLSLEGSSELRLLDIYITTLFGDSNSGNTTAMGDMSFWKMFKI